MSKESHQGVLKGVSGCVGVEPPAPEAGDHLRFEERKKCCKGKGIGV